MKTIYIVYAHRYTDIYRGLGLEKYPIGFARNKKEVDIIINNFRKQRQKGQYWFDHHIDENKNIECSTEKIKNPFLE